MYDVIIIGAGPAGITAGLYTQRGNLKTLIIHNGKTSLENANKIENYYGFENGITGKELYFQGIRQAQNIGIDVKNEEVIKIEMIEKSFKVKTTKNEYISKTIIIAMGTKKKTLQIDGVKKFEGRGISYCAICDGFFYRNKDVAVIGNGDYAISEVNDLLPVVNKITILTNGKTAPDIRSEKVEINNRTIKEIFGHEKVEKIEKRMKQYGFNTLEEMIQTIDQQKPIDIGMFVFIAQGTADSTDIAKKIGLVLENNKIKVNENMETNIKGIYACGDCIGGILQISKAVNDGMKTGLNVIKFLK